MSLTGAQIKQIEEFSMKKYSEYDCTHSENHGERTATLAVFIAKKEGADILICRLGGLLHQYHPESISVVEKFLRSIGVEEGIRKQLVHCVECVELGTIGDAKTVEAKVVFDADKLQTLGPFGLLREVAYRTVSRGVDFRDAVEQSKELQRDMFMHLQTKTGRELIECLCDFTRQIFKSFDEWNTLSFIES